MSVRTAIGIVLIMMALIGALTILNAAIEGDRAVQALIHTYGEKSPYEWYCHPPARELFHGELSGVSGLLYFGKLYFIAYGGIGFLGCCIGVQSAKPRSSACVIALSAGLVAALVWPWANYGPSIEIVAWVVD